MIWKSDRIRPTQPYFVLDGFNFRQEIYLKQGISHFYSLKVNEGDLLRAVPDGCTDISFEYGEDGMKAYVCGTVLSYHEVRRDRTADIFGVRFMPAVHPAFMNVSMRELTEKRIPFQDVLTGSQEWLGAMASEMDFYQRIRIFLEAYTRGGADQEKKEGRKNIVFTVKEMIYESEGKTRIADIAERTGYSERYVNKVFLEKMGFSPKAFCKILQFQRTLEYLNYGAPGKMTEAAVELGYYDQPQFTKDFQRYAGITPKKYLELMKAKYYQQRIHMDSGF